MKTQSAKSATEKSETPTKTTLIATKDFEATVIRETAYGIADDYGRLKCQFRLYRCDANVFNLEWDAGEDDGASIGIWTDHNDPEAKKVVDYDGVFSLPREAVSFLREQGFDVTEVA